MQNLQNYIKKGAGTVILHKNEATHVKKIPEKRFKGIPINVFYNLTPKTLIFESPERYESYF